MDHSRPFFLIVSATVSKKGRRGLMHDINGWLDLNSRRIGIEFTTQTTVPQPNKLTRLESSNHMESSVS